MSSKPFAYHIYLATLVLGIAVSGINVSAMSLPDSTTKKASIQATDENAPHMTREFKVDGPGILKVFTLAGDIDVERVEHAGKVLVELYVDRGYAFWSNTRNLDNYRITMLQRGNEVVASVEQKAKETGFFSDQMKFSFKVYVPASMSTQLKSSGGDIAVAGVKGEHLAKTSGGNVEVRNTEGKISVYTAGGNIGVRGSVGTIYAQTEGGNINIAESSGELRLRANGGQIRAEQIAGSMLARVNGGDIRAGFVQVSQGIRLETTAGDISLQIPRDGGYDLMLRGSQIRFPDTSAFSGSRRPNTVEGSLGDGGSTINLITEHGTITLDTGIY